ncbi:hypothetical protein OBJ96_03215 [Empedobacter falsenii]
MTKFNFSDIKFGVKENRFYHNIGDDFACFALWKSARPFRDKIRKELSEKFQILLETEIEWSEANFHQNAERLYEVPMFSEHKGFDGESSHGKKIGDRKFILFILKDENPDYTYAKSVSGKNELSNLNFVKAKYKFRDWIQEDTGNKYGVHSTNNIYEFFYQVPLLLGIDIFKQLLNGETLQIDKLSKDLEGANGWKNWDEVFEILNITTNYLVLRGFEMLPTDNPEKDLDVITDNYQKFASALGAIQKKKQPYKGYISVNNESISLDIRFVGDNYYNTAWAKEMLTTKVLHNGVVFVPRLDQYFFSLLFHAKVQKPAVKEKYYGILENAAKNLKFDWFELDDLNSNKKSGVLLKGYFQGEGYFYEDPLDIGVYKNEEVIKQLPKNSDFVNKHPLKKRVKIMLIKSLPPGVKGIIKKIIKK